jgi:hypothetical protein
MDHFPMDLVLIPSCSQRRMLLHASRFSMFACLPPLLRLDAEQAMARKIAVLDLVLK